MMLRWHERGTHPNASKSGRVRAIQATRELGFRTTHRNEQLSQARLTIFLGAFFALSAPTTAGCAVGATLGTATVAFAFCGAGLVVNGCLARARSLAPP